MISVDPSICGAKCEACSFRDSCCGCAATCGRPFGGACVAAEYIRVGGKERYDGFKEKLRSEVNSLLRAHDIPEADALYELPGNYVNLEYPIPSGKTVRFLDDTRIYLGCQIEFADAGICYGVVADAGFILVCSYSVNGSEAELLIYQKR